MSGLLLVRGSASHIPLRDESVQCAITSPPYWGLRTYAGEQREVWGGEPEHAHEWSAYARQDERYTGKRKWQHIGTEAQQNGVKVRDVDPNAWGHPQTAQESWCACGAWYGALGLEPTPELYVEHMVAIFREVRRVLRKDGTLWLNLGDSYAPVNRGENARPRRETMVGIQLGNPHADLPTSKASIQAVAAAGYKQKDLMGIPWMVAFALRADGWYLRSDIIWAKPNPMPESVTDRPTKAHEYVFLLSKSERYYYDAEAIKEPLTQGTVERLTQPSFDLQTGGEKDYGPESNRSARKALENLKSRVVRDPVEDHQYQHDTETRMGKRSANRVWSDADAMERMVATGRNKRTVWTIATRPYPGAHFATYPEQLVEPCILAGSAAKACGICGAPWERVTEVERVPHAHPPGKGGRASVPESPVSATSAFRTGLVPRATTIGWTPTCAHTDGTGASLVFDPFNGSGTTGRSAIRHGRSYVGLDISDEYLREQSRVRIDNIQHVMGGL